MKLRKHTAGIQRLGLGSGVTRATACPLIAEGGGGRGGGCCCCCCLHVLLRRLSNIELIPPLHQCHRRDLSFSLVFDAGTIGPRSIPASSRISMGNFVAVFSTAPPASVFPPRPLPSQCHFYCMCLRHAHTCMPSYICAQNYHAALALHTEKRWAKSQAVWLGRRSQ